MAPTKSDDLADESLMTDDQDERVEMLLKLQANVFPAPKGLWSILAKIHSHENQLGCTTTTLPNYRRLEKLALNLNRIIAN